MKFIFLLFTILSLNKGFCQKGEIIYKITTTDVEVNNKIRTKINDELELMSYTLLYDNKSSYFEINKNVPLNEYYATLAKIVTKGNLPFYQFKNKNESYQLADVSEKKYLIVDSTKMSNWKLNNETKKIKNYTCYKATINQFNERSQKYSIITAWYSPEISLPYGPIGFGGLPGLILQLNYNSVFIYSIDEMYLNKKNIVIKPLPNVTKISDKELLILMRKARKVTLD